MKKLRILIHESVASNQEITTHIKISNIDIILLSWRQSNTETIKLLKDSFGMITSEIRMGDRLPNLGLYDIAILPLDWFERAVQIVKEKRVLKAFVIKELDSEISEDLHNQCTDSLKIVSWYAVQEYLKDIYGKKKSKDTNSGATPFRRKRD